MSRIVIGNGFLDIPDDASDQEIGRLVRQAIKDAEAAETAALRLIGETSARNRTVRAAMAAFPCYVTRAEFDRAESDPAYRDALIAKRKPRLKSAP